MLHRFFIALLPPVDVQKVANEIKQHFADVYQSRKAFNSPPHITLQAPFKWEDENLPVLEESLDRFSQTQPPIPIALSGFGAFKPRVIFINPLKTPELMKIQQDLLFHLETQLAIVDEVAKKRTFSPHMTVAFQDLTKENFKRAWPEFKDRALDFEFVVPQLTLLIHNGKNWEIHKEFALQAQI